MSVKSEQRIFSILNIAEGIIHQPQIQWFDEFLIFSIYKTFTYYLDNDAQKALTRKQFTSRSKLGFTTVKCCPLH